MYISKGRELPSVFSRISAVDFMADGQIAVGWLHTPNNSFFCGCQSHGRELYVQ